MCNRNFVLFHGSKGTSWNSVVSSVSQHHNLKIDVYKLDAGKESALEIESSGAVLIRPDGYVALRVMKANHNSEHQLLQGLKQILHA
ncbi:hypothetical protein GI584_01800 [Gracilibacillus salitolerans]|uniref:Uncharacterized protein n=1 Tax=Gracilibacillus salitolerans TaxID=2663022 RepID=A0A5Q2TFF6_9BACI|nr:hypothetical protein GI584_01800 [Gracilibacillus salitolerans]